MLDNVFATSIWELLALFGAGIFGLVWHYLAKLTELRKTNHALCVRSYFAEHLPETLTAVMAVVAGIFGLIQIEQAGVFQVALLGYTIDSHVNKWRSRSGLV